MAMYGKCLEVKTFAVFKLIAKGFPLNHLLCTAHNGLGLMHCVSFPVNSVLCTIAKVFPLKTFVVYGNDTMK